MFKADATQTSSDEPKVLGKSTFGRRLSRLTISQRFMINVAGSMVVLGLLGFFAHISLARISKVASQVSLRSMPAMYTIGQVQSVAHETSMWVLKDIFAVSEEQREEFAAKILTNTARLHMLGEEYKGTVPPEEDHANYEHLSASLKEFAGFAEALLKLTAGEKAQEAMELKLSHLDPAFKKLMELVDREVESTKLRAHNDGQSVNVQIKQANFVLDVGVAASIVLGLLVGLMMVRTTKIALLAVARNVEETVKAVHQNVVLSTDAAKSLADGTIHQTKALERTGAALAGMGAMSNQTAQGAKSAKELSDLTRVSAEKGLAEVQQLNTVVSEIQTASKNVAAIIKTIDEIAFQTNILALNAAVEAARAGESGLGFAVVADEVRNLALRSAQAAKETSHRITDSISCSNRGRVVSDLVSQRLSDITQNARRTDEVVTQIATAAEEQRKGVGQITDAIHDVETVVTQNIEGAHQAGTSAELLRIETETLEDAVSHLLALIQGSTSATKEAAQTLNVHEHRKVATLDHTSPKPPSTASAQPRMRTMTLRSESTDEHSS